jgi:hypothetical protein
MAFRQYDANFLSVLPKMRAADDILADVTAGTSGRTTDVNKSNIARIELMIRDGDALYRRRAYEPALNEFRRARAEVYALLYPGFDVRGYVLAKDVALPLSKSIEDSLLALSGRVIDAIRPAEVESRSQFRTSADPIPDTLSQFTRTGFRESVTADEILQVGATEGVGLLNDNKPDAAIDLMSDALARARSTNERSDPSLTAALQLNLASAYLQVADVQKANAAAEASLGLFRSANDTVGEAQALHASAIAAQRAGNADRAKALFAQASETLKRASAPPSGTTPSPTVPTPTRPVPIPEVPRIPVPRTPGLSGVAVADVLPGALAASIGTTLTIGATSVLTRTAMLDRAAALGTRAATSVIVNRDVKQLQPITAMDAQTLTLRVPGRVDGWTTIPAIDDLQRTQQAKSWNVGVPLGETITVLKVGSGAVPAGSDVANAVYRARIDATSAGALVWPAINTSTVTFYLTQLYAYALPVKIADCYHNMGQYAKAESYYQLAAQYSYLNQQAEAISLWIRMARNTVEWGDSLYKLEKLEEAKAQYTKLIAVDATVPTSFFYTTTSLSTAASAAMTVIENISTRPLPSVNWEIAYLVLTAYGRLQQIAQNLDFYGLLLSPIHTFEYLQSVARGFAQEAIQAEREFVNFKSRQEGEEATRRDLEMAQAMAEAEAEGRKQQFLAAKDDQAAAEAALQLAVKRRDDAVAQRAQYASASAAQIWSQAAAQAQGMGEDSWYGEISELADKLARGESISGPRGKLAAAYTLYAGRKTRDYELKKMQDNIDELTRGITIATEQRDAAVHRTAAAEVAWEAAKQRAQMASASLDAFDAEFFTPEAWSKMADVMRDISRSYLYRAIRIAKLMERAYNFENDTALKVIKQEYGQGVATPAPGRDVKLLGGDSLLQDIESFTYNAITSRTRKTSRIKDVVSLASTYPAHFEQFRSTGLLAFETDLYEFDRLHPGFYGQRIEAVELEIIGLLPDNGLNGTLSAGGVSGFRKKDNTVGKRVHQVDTMALSSFLLRNDMFLYSTDTGVRGLFQGIGLGTTWQLHLPKRSNDFEFRRIFDVNLIVYYTATYDAALRTTVLALPPRPGEMKLLRNFALRQDFPDAWYGFYREGAANVQFERVRLPANQTNITIDAVHLRVMTRPGIANKNIQVRITTPSGATGTAQTDAMGVVSTDLPALAALAGGDPIGAWRIEVLGGPSLMDGGTLKLDRVYNVQIGLEYAFEYVAEAI